MSMSLSLFKSELVEQFLKYFRIERLPELEGKGHFLATNMENSTSQLILEYIIEW